MISVSFLVSYMFLLVKKIVICNKVDINCLCKLYRYVMVIELKCF